MAINPRLSKEELIQQTKDHLDNGADSVGILDGRYSYRITFENGKYWKTMVNLSKTKGELIDWDKAFENVAYISPYYSKKPRL